MAALLRKRFSLPLADFQDRMVAPYRSTSIRSPEGKVAITRELSSEIETCGVGATGETGIAEGFLERSTMLKQSHFLIVVSSLYQALTGAGEFENTKWVLNVRSKRLRAARGYSQDE